jgi:putative addiction module antidote
MAATIKVRKIGNSLGVLLPKEVADQLHIAEGDTLHVVTDADGAHLTPYDPKFDAAMKAFDETRRRYRNALRALAK